MATHLDLEEQEQLDQLKAFWKRYGSLIVWVLVLAAAAFVGWQQWNKWQSAQSQKAGQLYDELSTAAKAGDIKRTDQILADLKDRYPRALFSHQAALLAAKVQLDKEKPDAAAASLAWVAENAPEAEYRTIAKLRLAGVLLDQKKYDDALKQLVGADVPEFAGLVADRRGDILAAQGKPEEAKVAYQQAWAAIPIGNEYRNMVEAKLIVRGVVPSDVASKAGR
jgi:predicted negative regulator of RcsB-dependent stress response